MRSTRLGHRVCTGTCGPAQGPPDPVMGTALWRPGHRIMKKKLKNGARARRPGREKAAPRRSGSGSATASHRAPGRQRLAGHAGGGELGHGPSPMPRSDRARWCRRAQSNSGCMRIRRAARPPGTRSAAGRWPPAGTRRRWPGQGVPARACRAGPRGARPRCG
eukprot:scaffold6319_cov107-Isochrysis_galbana.AAC.1